MGRFFKRLWSYFGTSANKKFDEKADPEVLIQQAIEQEQRRHAQVTQQAAAVIGNRNQVKIQLARKIEESEKLKAQAKQALTLAQKASTDGDTAKSAQYEQAAQAFASRLVSVEADIETLKHDYEAADAAATQARAQAEESARILQDKLGERSHLLTQLQQAKMQEAVAKSVSSLSELSAPSDAVNLEQVRARVEQRYAQALGTTELASSSVEAQGLNIERASQELAAQSRLEELKASMSDDHAALNQGSPAALGTGDSDDSAPASGT